MSRSCSKPSSDFPLYLGKKSKVFILVYKIFYDLAPALICCICCFLPYVPIPVTTHVLSSQGLYTFLTFLLVTFFCWCLHGFASELLLGLCSDIISLRAPLFTLKIAHSLWSLIYPSVVYSSSLITWYNRNVFTCMCIVSSPIIKASIWARDMCW